MLKRKKITPEVVVTDEMAEAGYAALEINGPYGVICEPGWLENAYRAMAAMAKRDSAGSSDDPRPQPESH